MAMVPFSGSKGNGECFMKWIFGYGSLMWRPGFAFEKKAEARLFGHHRAFCVYSHVHRGTPERPGLVLGLDRGGSCRGVAFGLAEGQWAATIAYLREREQATSVYLEREMQVQLDSGERIKATAYLVDRAHRQYAGRLSLEDQLGLVRQGVGQSGANPDYVRNTVGQLDAMGIVDGPLHRLLEAL